MPGESRTSPRRMDAVEKQRQALALRYGGATYDAIAKALGYASRQGAQMAVEAALKKTLQEPADQLRKLDLGRLDTMLLAIWPAARQGDFPAIDMALKIMVRKAKLLGLDIQAPVPGSSREHPLWTQPVDAVDLSMATNAELDSIIEKARAIQEADKLVSLRGIAAGEAPPPGGKAAFPTGPDHE